MALFLLDTNIASHCLREQPAVVRHMKRRLPSELAVSSITEAELLFGLAKRPQATRLARAVQGFLRTFSVLAWDSLAAQSYAQMRTSIECAGKFLTDMDALIAAHALALGATLVSNDQAFKQVKGLQLEDWTI